jgi:hypothetical protein
MDLSLVTYGISMQSVPTHDGKSKHVSASQDDEPFVLVVKFLDQLSKDHLLTSPATILNIHTSAC